jgi:hypothetical protein
MPDPPQKPFVLGFRLSKRFWQGTDEEEENGVAFPGSK